MSEHPTVAEVIREMRVIAIIAGQASVEGQRDFQAEAEAERASRWADALERASSLAPVAPKIVTRPAQPGPFNADDVIYDDVAPSIPAARDRVAPPSGDNKSDGEKA